MKRLHRNCGTFVAAASAMYAAAVFAAVGAEEAKQLGGPVLTEWGSERAGNKEGTIPAYKGEQPVAPATWDPKNPGQRPNPYAGEKPLFSITAQNAPAYADKLDGMAELFKIYPNFRMDIYPTHRTNSMPKFVLDNSIKNATSCKTTDNELVLEGCHGGYPFPIPKTGAEVMWNKLLTYESYARFSKTTSTIVPTKGSQYILVNGNDCDSENTFYDNEIPGPRPSASVFWRVRCIDWAPARAAGGSLIVIDSLDNYRVGRRAYQYIPGQRRVKLAPDLAYDTPAPTSGGGMTMDDIRGFMGSIDRYTWTLKGKKEKFILYNNFDIYNANRCSNEAMSTRNFPNPDCIRWELHRVWAVEAKLKSGFRHVYPRRVMYWDEDGYGPGITEQYDASNKLYRLGWVLQMPWYKSEGEGQNIGGFFHLDMVTGSWAGGGVGACAACGWKKINKRLNPVFFSPEGLAGEGVR